MEWAKLDATIKLMLRTKISYEQAITIWGEVKSLSWKGG